MNENNITLKASLTLKDIALIGVMTATLEAGKYALSFIPNIEIVSLLIILYTIFFEKKDSFVPNNEGYLKISKIIVEKLKKY